MSERQHHVFIVGSKGIPAQYGGFETFVDKLVSGQVDSSITYHVACLQAATEYEAGVLAENCRRTGEHTFEYRGAQCYNIKAKEVGPARAVFYDIDALHWAISYVKAHHIERPIFYVLACRIGPFIGHIKKEIVKLGGVLYVNPDGHEFLRAKWNAAIRQYWKYSERLMVKHADLLICDSKNIEKYIRNDYARYQPNTTFIAYGADVEPSALSDDDCKVTQWYTDKGVRPHEYYITVGRFVPENNFKTIISEFMKSRTDKDLVLITGTKGVKFFDTLKAETHFDTDSRIKFVGTVYDQQLLTKIRENAYGYIHGHSVGGTNPSLLEALGSTKLNLLFDIGFNREVGEDAAFYWSMQPGALSKLIEGCDALSENRIEEMGHKAQQRILDEYSWAKIVGDYENLFKKINA